MDDIEYEELSNVINLDGLSYGPTYLDEEIDILQPRLEALGYMDIEWRAGETDSFGPLTRVCKALALNGEIKWFIYG